MALDMTISEKTSQLNRKQQMISKLSNDTFLYKNSAIAFMAEGRGGG